MGFKKLPYGNCNFADIVESGYAYVDKTRYIEILENEANKYQFMLRPRRFGKSLFLSVLENYYDINRKDKFDALFSDLYISKHPTLERGRYAVLSFDFSCINTDNIETFKASFSYHVQERVNAFLEKYGDIFSNAADMLQTIKERQPGIDAMNFAYRAAELSGIPMFVIIDEYDNFANDLITISDSYEGEIIKDGIVRTFYKSLKSKTGSILRRIFITGVSPMDITSVFNMITDLSMLPKYNEMYGFTRGEVERLMGETGIDKNLITFDIESYYNGYMFNNKGKDKVCNSQMILFLLNHILQHGEQPEKIVDPNLKIGYDKLKFWARNEHNCAKLLDISANGGISGQITRSITLEELQKGSHFISLLYYLGMLTCGGTSKGEMFLKIPNYSVKTLYFEYLMEYFNGLV